MSDDVAQGGLFAEADLQPVEEVKVVQTIYVHFERPEDIEAFGKLIGFPCSSKTRALRYPPDDFFADRAESALAAMKPEDDPEEVED